MLYVLNAGRSGKVLCCHQCTWRNLHTSCVPQCPQLLQPRHPQRLTLSEGSAEPGWAEHPLGTAGGRDTHPRVLQQGPPQPPWAALLSLPIPAASPLLLPLIPRAEGWQPLHPSQCHIPSGARQDKHRRCSARDCSGAGRQSRRKRSVRRLKIASGKGSLPAGRAGAASRPSPRVSEQAG